MTASLLAVAIGTSLMGQTASLSHNAMINDGMRYPGRITLTGGGGIYVTEQPTNQVLEYDSGGVLVGTYAIAEGPVGIALHADGRIFVSRADGAVAYYDAAFVEQGTLDTSNSPFTMAAPNGIAIHPTTGEIYVADAGASMVFVFDPVTNQLDRAWGIEGQGLLELESPLALALDPAYDGAGGRVLVADTDNFRIHVFSSDGLSGFKFGYRIAYIGMNATAWVARSSGLAVDSCSNIYVADALMGTIRAFSPEGVDLDIANPPVVYGTGAGELRVPRDLLIDGTTLYVSSTNNASVEVFGLTCSPGDEPIGDPGGDSVRRKVSGKDRSTGRRTADVDEKSMPESASWVDNPFDVVAAMRDGFYCEEFDLDCDGIIDIADLDIALTTFGAGTAEDFLGGGLRDYPFPLLPPHMHTHATGSQYPDICGRCHSMNGLPGGMLTDWGQENLCISCHGASGQANHKPIGGAGNGNSHAWGIDAASGGVAGPDPSSPLALHLDGGLIRCGTCHNPHESTYGSPYLRVTEVGSALCKECHRGEDAPADHVVGGGAHTEFCMMCHDMHAVGDNLSLVAESVYGSPVTFTARTGPNSFDDGDPAVDDGICQVCHTATTYHKQDGTGLPHHDGEDCTGCHPHASGFMPTGGDCTSCHSTVQGGRRAIVGEFPLADAHAHYGAELNAAACQVCHDVTTHMNGFVELIDADTGALYTFATPGDLASDPDLSDFCASCHDADGATRLLAPADPLDPFGNGNVPPDVATRFQGTLQWQTFYGDFCFGSEGMLRQGNSHHDISDADQAFSGAKLECLNCHGAHTSSASQPLADPAVGYTAWAGTGNDFCLACHGGGLGPTDPAFPSVFDLFVNGPVVDPSDPLWIDPAYWGGVWDWNTILGGACAPQGGCSSLRGIDSCDYKLGPWYMDYTWTHSAHGPDSKRGWPGYSGAPGADLDCKVCHDPHGSYTPTNTLGNPYMIRDYVDGTPYVDDGVRPNAQWTGPPWNTFGTARDVVVTISGTDLDWGSSQSLCSVCHASWLSAYDWHSYCTGCQTCHGYGMAFGEYDWGPTPANDTPCPSRSASGGGDSTPSGKATLEGGPLLERPLHLIEGP